MVTSKTLCILALVVLAGCGDPTSVDRCQVGYVQTAMAYGECSREHTCALKADEYAWLQEIKRRFPQCFVEGVER